MIKSGVPGLDEILKGGFIEGSAISVIGGPGTGKSIFSLQFAYEGCKNGEPCLYLVTEETVENLRRESKSVGLDFDKFEKKGLITFLREEPKKILSIATPIQIIRKKKIKRVILDNIMLFKYATGSESEFRKSFLDFLFTMKEEKVTLLVITPSSISGVDIVYEPQDFLFDGLILLTKIRKGSVFERTVSVLKLRGQQHLLDIYPLQIDEKGMKIYPKQIPFSLK